MEASDGVASELVATQQRKEQRGSIMGPTGVDDARNVHYAYKVLC